MIDRRYAIVFAKIQFIYLYLYPQEKWSIHNEGEIEGILRLYYMVTNFVHYRII